MLTDPTLATAPPMQALGWRYLHATAPYTPEAFAANAKRAHPPERQTVATLRVWWEELRQAHIAHARAVIDYLSARFSPDGVPGWAHQHLADARAGRLRCPTSYTVMQLSPDEAARLGRVSDA